MRPLPRAVLCLGLLLTACPKRVTVDGQAMSRGDADAQATREIEAARREVSPPVAATRLEGIAAKYGDVPAAAEALYQAAQLWRAVPQPQRAREDLAQVASRFPLSPRATAAKHELGLLDLEAGRPREALASLAAVYDKLPAAERPEAARDTARAAEGARAWADAVRWRAEAARQARGDARAREVARAVEHVDALTLPELQRLQSELGDDPDLAPAILLKLARVQHHLADDAAAERAAREVTQRWPNSRWAADAGVLLERLTRRSNANARTIGVAVPLTGSPAQKGWGEAVLRGVTLALGEDGPYTLAVKDTRGEAEGARAALEELAAKDGAVAALGGVVTAEAARAAAAAQEQGLPFVSLSRVEDVTQAGPFVFRNMLTARAQAAALAELAQRRGIRRFAVMYPQITYGQELANAFWDEVDARGGEMRGAESYEHDRTTFGPLVKSLVGKLWLEERQDYLAAVAEAGRTEQDPYRRRKAVEKLRDHLAPVVDFDALFIPDFAGKVALIAPALAVEDVFTQTCDEREVERVKRAAGREDARPVQLLGANGWDDPSLVEKAGKYVECAIFVDGFFAGSERPATKQFVAAFQARYGHLPSILEASAYDAARMIRAALDGGATTREAVRDRLGALKGFPGATGDLAFDARREVAKPLFYLTVEKGVLRELTPQEVAATAPGGS